MTTKSWKYIFIISISLIHIVLSTPIWVTARDNTTFLIEIDQKYNWLQAVRDCKLRSSQLVAIDSEEKNTLLKEILLDNLLKSYNMWIGGKNAYGDRGQRDDVDELEPFYWHATKQEFSYTYWAEGYPDSNRYIEHCVHILQNSLPPFAWKDDSCDNAHYGYICEVKVVGAKEDSGEQQSDGENNTNEDYSEQSSEQNFETTSQQIVTEDIIIKVSSSTTEINSDSDHNLTWSHFPSYTSSSV